MIDLCRKSILSQAGKDAGNKTISEYTRYLQEKYSEYTAKLKAEKERPKPTRESYDLYL